MYSVLISVKLDMSLSVVNLIEIRSLDRYIYFVKRMRERIEDIGSVVFFPFLFCSIFSYWGPQPSTRGLLQYHLWSSVKENKVCSREGLHHIFNLRLRK